jgi:hypothetical protein
MDGPCGCIRRHFPELLLKYYATGCSVLLRFPFRHMQNRVIWGVVASGLRLICSRGKPCNRVGWRYPC